MSGLLQLHLGVLLLGGAGLFAKLIDLPALDMIGYRGFLSAAFLALVLYFGKHSLKITSLRDLGIALLVGSLAAVHWVTYFYAIQVTTVATAMLALFTYPMMTVFIEPIFRRTLPDKKDVLLGLAVLLGVAMLFPDLWFGESQLSDEYLVGVGAGLLSALCFALRNVLVQHKFGHYNGGQSMFFQFLITGLLLLPFISVPASDLTADSIWKLVLFSVVFSACAHALFVSAIGHTGAKTAALVACLQPVYGICFAFLILAEAPALATIGGGSIILAAAMYETVSSKKSSKNAQSTVSNK